MSTLHFAKFNNYASRILRGVGYGLDDYDIEFSLQNVNFNIRDGVSTSHVVNDKNKILGDGIEFPFNYCIVTDDAGDIQSRWFITDMQWKCKYQWDISLLRDVLVDYNGMYNDKPFYCEKGMVDDASDILVYNAEPYSFNQILKSRTSLGASSERAIVGFVDKTWPGGFVYFGEFSGRFENIQSSPFDEFVNGPKMAIKPASSGGNVYPGAVITVKGADGKYYSADVSFGPGGATTRNAYTYTPITESGYSGIVDEGVTDISTFIYNVQTAFNGAYNSIGPNISALSNKYYSEEASKYDGEKVLIGNVSYNVSIPNNNATINNIYSSEATEQILARYVMVNLGSSFKSASESLSYAGVYGIAGKLSLSVDTTTRKVDLTDQRYHIPGVPYDIFYMADSTDTRLFASYFASQYFGAGFIYDIQLVPYAPDVDIETRVPITESRNLFWATSDSRSINLTHPEIKTYSGISDIKKGCTQDTCRIVSPNGGSVWEFNPAQIGGVPANSIKVEFTLMPFNSTFHIFPTFGGIYGNVNKLAGDGTCETRGIVMQGPWSIAFSTNEWSTYQLRQSSYADSWDRTIENMSFNQKMGKISDTLQVTSGIIGGAGSGAVAGGPIGAGLGAIGSLATGLGGAYLNAMQRTEQMNYAKDQHELQLRNIGMQSQPLAKTQSFTVVNALFPFIEYYSASDSEKTILDNLLKQHGYTIGKMTTFGAMKENVNSLSRYVRGRLMEFDMPDDTHIAEQIIRELAEGVYIEL